MRFAPQHDGDKHYLTLQFSTPLTATSTTSNMDLTIGRKARIASASLTISGAEADRTVRVQMQTPQWARGKDLQEHTTTNASTVTITSAPVTAEVPSGTR